jgi:sec-independent protein translocase protein TatA
LPRAIGAKKLRNVGSDLGSAVRGFKKAMNDGEDEQSKQLSELTGGKDADFSEQSSSVKSDSSPASDAAMFEVGLPNHLIFGIALLVLGPERLPSSR